MNLNSLINFSKQQVETFFYNFIENYTANNTQGNIPLYSAMKYSVLNGGKKLRPALVYATAIALDFKDLKALDVVATSLELIHCYSLIHDDLPSMDNDDLRRGKPTCHKAFDEATAILTGDALQTLAFEILSDEKLNSFPDNLRIKMVNVLAQAAGMNGMILGQCQDIAAENTVLTLEQLTQLHKNKTGALIKAALQLTLIATNNKEQRLYDSLLKYGEQIGLAFQIYDDILDVTTDTEILGKPAKSDQNNNKYTFPSLMGLEESKKYAESLYDSAIEELSCFGDNASLLKDLALLFINRKN